MATKTEDFLTFGPRPTDTVFSKSPDVGADCTCSRCGEPILKGVPIRAFTDETPMREYRYHPACVGIVMVDVDDEDEYWNEEASEC
jgi:hypothetical protein